MWSDAREQSRGAWRSKRWPAHCRTYRRTVPGAQTLEATPWRRDGVLDCRFGLLQGIPGAEMCVSSVVEGVTIVIVERYDPWYYTIQTTTTHTEETLPGTSDCRSRHPNLRDVAKTNRENMHPPLTWYHSPAGNCRPAGLPPVVLAHSHLDAPSGI